MSYGSLFERLAGDTQPHGNLAHLDSATASVARHLSRMLSTRAGSVQTLPNYGLPDLNDMRLSVHDALQQARIAIEQFIEQHEPRLRQVRVSALPQHHDPLHLSFAIEGVLDSAGEQKKISLAASLNGSGKVQVQ